MAAGVARDQDLARSRDRLRQDHGPPQSAAARGSWTGSRPGLPGADRRQPQALHRRARPGRRAPTSGSAARSPRRSPGSPRARPRSGSTTCARRSRRCGSGRRSPRRGSVERAIAAQRRYRHAHAVLPWSRPDHRRLGFRRRGGRAGRHQDGDGARRLCGHARSPRSPCRTRSAFTASIPIPPRWCARRPRPCWTTSARTRSRPACWATSPWSRRSPTLLDRARGVPAVVDPVMVAKGGASLLAAEAVAALRSGSWCPARPCSRPTRPRPRRCTGLDGRRPPTTCAAPARRCWRAGATAVLMKGGHIAGRRVVDLLMTADGETRLRRRAAWRPATPTAPAARWPAPAPSAWPRA